MSEFADWIVWQDGDVCVVNKPAGVLSQGGEGDAGDNLVDLACAHFRRSGIAVLHRLDRNVSGLVLLARTTTSKRVLSEAFRDGKVDREYVAIVLVKRGQSLRVGQTFAVDAELRKDRKTNIVTARDPKSARSDTNSDWKPSRTEFEVRALWNAPLGPCAELLARPITGRSHQIRAHLAHAGFALVGDPKYGVLEQTVRRPLLHATRLRFVHPKTADPLTVDAPPSWASSSLGALSPAGSGVTIRQRKPPK